MPAHLLRASRLFTPDEEILDGALLIEDQKIIRIGPREAMRLPAKAMETNLGDRILAPGFVDIHVHGAGGHDVMEATPEALCTIARALACHGTTSFLTTTVTASPHETDHSLAGMARYIESDVNRQPGRAQIAGIHLEGPFINVARRGVHPLEHITEPSLPRYHAMLTASAGHAKIITLAPELPGASALIRQAIADGLIVSLGHTDATYAVAAAAIEQGARHATHVFNAMRPFHQREAGVLGALLTDSRVTAELIADGLHVDLAAIRLSLAAKGAANIVLVSDGTAATGMPDGAYRLGNFNITVTGGVCRDSEGRLAGSTLTLDRAVSKIVEAGASQPGRSVTLAQAWAMASSQPAARLGLSSKGSLAAGGDADIVVLAPSLDPTVPACFTVDRVMARGAWVE
jgi:N-acetylglucosamine-6-phosphate deacetylase